MRPISLQERLKAISFGLVGEIPNNGFRILAADQTEGGINLSSEEGQRSLDPLLSNVDLLILDNLSTLCTGSESASDAWLPMQNWLLKLRRQAVAVLLIHHAGTNGRQRGTSRREDALDMCDDDCSQCGAWHMSPYDSDDLTEIIEEREGQFLVYRSPRSAEHYPNYERVAKFPTLKQAETYLALLPTQR